MILDKIKRIKISRLKPEELYLMDKFDNLTTKFHFVDNKYVNDYFYNDKICLRNFVDDRLLYVNDWILDDLCKYIDFKNTRTYCINLIERTLKNQLDIDYLRINTTWIK